MWGWTRSEFVGSSRLQRWAEPCSLQHYRQRCSVLGPRPCVNPNYFSRAGTLRCVGLRQCRACWCGGWNVAWQSQNWRVLRGCFPCRRGCCFQPVTLAGRRWTRTRIKRRRESRSTDRRLGGRPIGSGSASPWRNGGTRLSASIGDVAPMFTGGREPVRVAAGGDRTASTAATIRSARWQAAVVLPLMPSAAIRFLRLPYLGSIDRTRDGREPVRSAARETGGQAGDSEPVCGQSMARDCRAVGLCRDCRVRGGALRAATVTLAQISVVPSRTRRGDSASRTQDLKSWATISAPRRGSGGAMGSTRSEMAYNPSPTSPIGPRNFVGAVWFPAVNDGAMAAGKKGS